MAGMIKSNIHHFDGFVGLAGNGGGSGKDGGRAAVCGASLVGTGSTRSGPSSVLCCNLCGLLWRDWQCGVRAIAGVGAGHDLRW